MAEEYTLSVQQPLAEEFLALRSAVQWSNPSATTAASALHGSLFCICIRLHDELIAFGRVIGDGAFNFYIQDVIVHPEHQGKGLGKAVMLQIMCYIEKAGGDDACISLMAAKGTTGFYAQFGFSPRSAESPGMQRLPLFRRR